VSVTVTFEADPPCVEIVTVYAAFCPRWMLACEVWTVTQSSGWVGLLARLASSEAVEVVAGAWLCDCDGEAELDVEFEAELDAGGEVDGGGELDRDGDVDWLGASLGLADEPGELEDAEGEGDGGGEEDGDGEGLGEGEPVLAAGSGWHVVSVLSVVAAARAVVRRSPCESAWAVPGRPTSPPSSTKLPASKLAAAVRTGLKRITLACLR
jgi:hypothetical protein